MHIIEGWVVRIHGEGPTGKVGIYLKGPPITEKQRWGGFLEAERLFPTRTQAERVMRRFPAAHDIVARDARHIRLEIADHPDEWVAPFTSARSYVVLWYFPHHSDERKRVMERVMGTRSHLADDDLTGTVGYIPGADFYQNGNVPFPDFESAKYCAYESGRQARAYAKIAIITMSGA